MVTTGDPRETTRWSPGTSQRYRGHRGSGRCALALRPAAGKSLESRMATHVDDGKVMGYGSLLSHGGTPSYS